MKVLVFASFYHPFKGGYAESLHELAKRLAAKGHSVLVLACDTNNQPERERKDGVEIVRVKCWNPAWLNKTYPIPAFSLIKILKRLGKESFDAVSTQTRFYPLTWIGWVFAKAKKIPCVHTERGSCHINSGNRFIKGVGIAIDHTLGRLVCSFSNRVVGVSQAACDFARRLGAKNPVKIYNGIDIDFWRAENIHYAKPATATFVGRLVEAKGVQDLLCATAQLHEVRLRVIGDGPYKEKLIELARNLGIQNRVEFLGEMNHKQIREMLWQSDIFVNPSYSEGLPRSVLEAAAAGVPIVATDVGGTCEVVSPQSAFLVKPKSVTELAEAIKKQLAERRRPVLGKRFDWEDIVQQYEKVFDSNNIL